MHLSLINRRFLLAVSLLSAACKHDAPMAHGREPAEHSASQLSSVKAYPRARWRLANSGELDHVVLWISQILIRYEGANSDPAFALADWHSPSPGGHRSRAEALNLAHALREQAAKEPAHFAELALRHSEDVATRALGGSMGGTTASQLLFSPEVLDALAATPVGQVSQVIETSFGFHVLLRRAPPAEDTVSGAHILIAHQAADWIRVLSRGEVPTRSRDEALALANHLYEKAKRWPEEFSTLVEQYSEHRDAERGGDMGSWSTREPTFYPREVEILARLAVGEVAPPVDSHIGFQIIQRTSNQPRQRYAMEEIRLFFDPAVAAHDPSSPVAVLAKATELSLQLRADPLRFEGLRKETCCSYSEQWDEGRGSPALTEALSRLEPGQIAREPIRSEFSYVIVKRVEPTARHATPTRFDLPQPNAPDILRVIRARDDTFLKDEIRHVGEKVASQMRLPESAARQVAELHGGPGRFEGLKTPESRGEAFSSLLTDMEEVLGPDMYPRYRALVDAHFTNVLLGDAGASSLGG
jgi:parvulin-like peptidyl-prolyl isomerase